jgi:membrane fusion protein (multidrug efflux system)
MEPNTQEQKAPKKTNRTFLIVLIVLVAVGSWFGITKYRHAQHHEETDDAQIEAKISPAIPRISGYIKELRVSDNQLVKKGDTLMILDDRDLRLKLAQAEAALATAQSSLTVAHATSKAANANIASAQAGVSTIDAQIETAKVNVWRTSEDLKRYDNLIKDHSITQQQYEQQVAAKQTAERQLQVLIEQKKQASSQTGAVATQSAATASQIGVASAKKWMWKMLN